MFGSSRCQPLNIINLWRAVSVIHLLYNSGINIRVTANKNIFSNNVQTLSVYLQSSYSSYYLQLLTNTLCHFISKTAPITIIHPGSPRGLINVFVLFSISRKYLSPTEQNNQLLVRISYSWPIFIAQKYLPIWKSFNKSKPPLLPLRTN